MTFRIITLGAAAGALLAAAAPARAQAPSVVRQACQEVMGLDPGEAHYVACAASLSHTLDARDRGLAEARARQDCQARGLAPDTPELARCILDAQHRASPAGVAPAASFPSAGGAPTSFFYASFNVRRAREQAVCAGVGLDPAGGPFAQCVASLAAAMQRADNPQP